MPKNKKTPNFKKVTKNQTKKQNGVVKSTKKSTVTSHNKNVTKTGSGKQIVLERTPLTGAQKLLIGGSIGGLAAMGLAIGLPFAFHHGPTVGNVDITVTDMNLASTLAEGTAEAYATVGISDLQKNELVKQVATLIETSYKGGSTGTLDGQQKGSAKALATYMLENGKTKTFTTTKTSTGVVIAVMDKTTGAPASSNVVPSMASTNFIYESPAPVAAPFRAVASATPTAITSITMVIYNKEVVSATSKPAPATANGIDFVDGD